MTKIMTPLLNQNDYRIRREFLYELNHAVVSCPRARSRTRRVAASTLPTLIAWGKGPLLFGRPWQTPRLPDGPRCVGWLQPVAPTRPAIPGGASRWALQSSSARARSRRRGKWLRSTPCGICVPSKRHPPPLRYGATSEGRANHFSSSFAEAMEDRLGGRRSTLILTHKING